MPGIGFHYWNDARNKPGGVTGIGPNPNQYNSWLDVLHNSGEVFFAFDYPEVFAIPSNSLSGLFSTVTLPNTVVLQLLNQGVNNRTAFINLVTSTASSNIALGADFITLQSGGSTVPISFPVPLQQNFLVNGNLDVWQRGTSFTSTGYTADRWRFTKGASDNVVSQAGNPPVGSNFAIRLQRPNLSVNTAQSLLEQGGESVNCTRLLGVPTEVSFWYRAGTGYSGGGETVTVYGGTGTDEPSPSAYTGRTTLQSLSITPTTTWQQAFFRFNATGSVNEFGITLTKTNSGTAGAFDFVDYAQLQIGSIGVESQGEALSRCQRYFQRYNASGDNFFGVGVFQAINATTAQGSFNFKPTMRIRPNITIVGTGLSLGNFNATAAYPVTSLVYFGGTVAGQNPNVVATAPTGALVAGNATLLYDNGSTTSDLLLDAEL